MQVLHKNGFTDQERKYLLPFINLNIVEALTLVLNEIKEKDIPLENPDNKVCPQWLFNSNAFLIMTSFH
jgi:hypothetical protein